jgi:hypothetical protein
MKYTKAFLLGLLMWAVPFITSFLFFDVNTKSFTIDVHYFKTVMLLESSLLGVLLAIYYFKSIEKNFFYDGIVLGLIWFVINCVLDILILLPMSNMTAGVWFGQIGARYLMAPIMTGAMGYMADRVKISG